VASRRKLSDAIQQEGEIMKSYSDKVLTIIAVCVVIQTVSQIPWVEKAYASSVQKVVICAEDRPFGSYNNFDARPCGSRYTQPVDID